MLCPGAMRTCSLCQKNETALSCGLCACAVCKSCALILDSESFEYLKKRPEDLTHSAYCPACYDARVAAALDEYNETLERAKDIDVYFKNQSKETRLIKRIEKPIRIQECADRDEVVMRLAFFAAQMNYNAVVDIDLISEKVGNGSYKKLVWRGSGVPANASSRTQVHDKSIWHNPN